MEKIEPGMCNDESFNFSSGYIHEGDLFFYDNLLEELPPDLTVKGNLDLSFSKVKKLNPGLMVFGDLILSHSLLKTLPAQIYVEGDLVLKDSFIEILPEYLTVYGQIDLSVSKVCKLSHHLTVSSLDLAGTKIEQLPKFLTVDIPPAEICERKCFTNSKRLGVLALQNSKVTHLTDYAKIHSVDLQGTQVISYGKNLEIEYLTLGKHKLEGIPGDSRFTSVFISHNGVNLKEATELRPVRDIQIENCLAILPENLELDCSLEFYQSSNSDLPENLIINGCLTINDTQIRRIPQSLKIMNGSFILEGARTCCEFPEKFEVRDLELYSTSIPHLPDELYIAGYLVLQDSLIANLPNKLETGINLIIRDNKAPLSIPDQATILIGHSLYWAYAPFETWPKNLLVCGGIFLAHSSIKSLPDNFLVNGTLDLSDSCIESLPENLTVLGDLLLNNTRISHLPENLIVCGRIIAEGSDLNIEMCETMSKKILLRHFLPTWVHGKYAFFEGYDGCEILEDNGDKKLVRPLGQKSSLWLKRRSGKWEGPYPYFKPEFPLAGY